MGRMEGELIIVALISTMGGLFGLYLVNQNWFKRQEIKYRYQMKRAKLSQKMKVPVKEETGILDQASQWLPILKNLDSDQLGGLIDTFTGGGGGGATPLDDESSGLMDILDKVPPEVIDSFLKGLSKKEGGGDTGFKGQV